MWIKGCRCDQNVKVVAFHLLLYYCINNVTRVLNFLKERTMFEEGRGEMQRAVRTPRFWLAVILADHHEQGMVFIEKRCVLVQNAVEKPLVFVVGCLVVDYAVPRQHPFGINIDNEYGLVERIQEYGIRGFRAYAMHIEQRRPEGPGIASAHSLHAAPVFFDQKCQEGL